MTAADIALALTDALNRRGASSRSGRLQQPPSRYITAVVVPGGGPIEVDEQGLRAMGIKHVVEAAAEQTAEGVAAYDPDALVAAIASIVAGGAT